VPTLINWLFYFAIFFKGSIEKKTPPRPAPPRPQTPNLVPIKPVSANKRPQSSLDFTINQKVDFLKNFGDPFTQTIQNSLINGLQKFSFLTIAI
jgi:hypothetical protein